MLRDGLKDNYVQYTVDTVCTWKKHIERELKETKLKLDNNRETWKGAGKGGTKLHKEGFTYMQRYREEEDGLQILE